ncbi:hypothetical protein SEA_ATUIN_155 [Arthrobacter phage Atuin]|nr:hypothetical protein SEA_ATUIN_254 [Arthrobacter phage Atuin]
MAVFSLSGDDKGKTLAIIFSDGSTEIVSETHISFKALLNIFLEGGNDEDHIRELSQVIETTQKKMTALSERVSVLDDKLLFDGDEISGYLMEVIKDLFVNGEKIELQPLVRFLEKASTNPSIDSVDDLYRWIKNGDLVIDEDGDVISYKGTEEIDGVRYSLHSGKAYVDGVEVVGRIPYAEGSVVTMPRSEVNADRRVGCSTGLHVGTHSYARNVGNVLLLVKFNPRDVVAVPEDCNGEKIRVSRLVVLKDSEDKQRLDTRYVETKVEVEDVAPPATPEEAKVAYAAKSYRDPKTGRFLKGGNAPRDPKTGRFLSGV